MIKKTYKLKGMHCTSCAMVIESDLEDAGVKAFCSYAKELLDVEFDEQKLTETRIKEIVKHAGYEVVISL